jgi:hypothetical protein
VAKVPPRNVFRLILRNPNDDWHFDLMERVLRPTAKGIRECIDTIDKAAASGNDEYAQIVADDEVEVIEGLLGVVFVVCQTEIERVTRAVELLHKHAGKVPPPKGPITLTTTGTDKGSIMATGSPNVGSSTVTEIQALNAVANYFKHRLAWSRDWAATLAAAMPSPTPLSGGIKSKASPKDKQTAATIRALQAVGLEEGSSGNLRTAAEVLGNAGYTDVGKIVDMLRRWRANLFKAYEAELAVAGLM